MSDISKKAARLKKQLKELDKKRNRLNERLESIYRNCDHKEVFKGMVYSNRYICFMMYECSECGTIIRRQVNRPYDLESYAH